MVVLPWRGGYRGFAWNDRRAVLDPAPRFFPGDVLIDDRLYLDGRTLACGGPAAAGCRGRPSITADPEGSAACPRRPQSVLVEKGNGACRRGPAGADVLHDGPGLDSYRPRHVTVAASDRLRRSHR